ncbi:hypothetical protein [Pedobacter nototheniae]|uniref:hypothetical protein n=1 Tax=Pedobacter nototheniae TaxID=2488994 RepID=UPI00292E1B1D|nr:hypothetical protein [Pedobacter nototheniae]
MAKTKWIIEPGKLTIYPKRGLRLMGLITLIAIAGISVYLYTQKEGYTSQLGFGFLGFLLLVPILILLIGENNIVFDGSSRTLYNKIAGITIGSTPFDQIAAIEPYQIIGSGFNYRVFKKSNRHGKGLIISAGYSKTSNLNLQAFEQEVLPKIDELVFANAPVMPKQTIYDFEFFKEEGGAYIVRDNKVAALIFGIILIGVTVIILLSPTFMANEAGFGKILTTYFPVVIGAVLVSTFFSSITFDKNQRQIIHSTFAGRFKKVYAFDDLIRFQIIRKSTNFIYTGTEVKAQIESKAKNKSFELVLRNFRSTKKIERFLDEANTILGRV